MHSHEILFNRRISLKKYCIKILYREVSKEIINLAGELKIGIMKYSCCGLNKFIDEIDENIYKTRIIV